MRDEEHRLQVGLFAWAEWARLDWPELGLLFAVPNGGGAAFCGSISRLGGSCR